MFIKLQKWKHLHYRGTAVIEKVEGPVEVSVEECEEYQEYKFQQKEGTGIQIGGKAVNIKYNSITDEYVFYDSNGNKVLEIPREQLNPGNYGSLTILEYAITYNVNEDGMIYIRVCSVEEEESCNNLNLNCKWTSKLESANVGGYTATIDCKPGEIVLESSCGVADYSNMKVLGSMVKGKMVAGSLGEGWICEFLNNGKNPNQIEIGALCCS